MALVYQCDVFCDRCSEWVEQGESQHETAAGLGKGARDVAKSHGWKRVKTEFGTYEDLCPTCAKKMGK